MPIDVTAFALAGARLELQRILTLFPALRTEVINVSAEARERGEHTHSCEHCRAGFTPDARHRTRARVCAKPACKAWLAAQYRKR